MCLKFVTSRLSMFLYSWPRTNKQYRHQSKMSSSKRIHCKGLCGRCLSEFLFWRYSPSCRYFRPSFVNCCTSLLLSGSTHPPSLPVRISILYTRIHCVRGGWASGPQINTCRKVPLQVNFFRWRNFELPSMNLISLRSLLSAFKTHLSL